MSSNKNVVLIMGPPNTGKSMSLYNLKDQEKFVYMNADLKELPFKDRFAMNVPIANATDVLDYIPQIEEEAGVQGAILDTITFLMAMYERQYVNTAINTQAAWGNYGNFYRDIIHEIKAGTKDYVIMAHEDSFHNEQTSQMETRVPVKGQVGRIGVEADFSTILSTKQMPVSTLKKYENDLLNITEEEEEDGVKYVFCTRISKEYVGSKMRSPVGLWKREELYIDNDIGQVLKRLKEYFK